MSVAKIAGIGGALTFTAALGIGGYAFAESRNDGSPVRVEALRVELDVASVGYIAVGGQGTCEADVIGTMLHINAKNTPASVSLTQTALNSVCGDKPEHQELAVKAKDGFDKVKTARASLATAKDEAAFDASEKLAGPSVAIILGWAAACLFVVAPTALRQKRY